MKEGVSGRGLKTMGVNVGVSFRSSYENKSKPLGLYMEIKWLLVGVSRRP